MAVRGKYPSLSILISDMLKIRNYKPALLLGFGITIFIMSVEMVLRCLPVDSGLRMQATDGNFTFMRAYPNQEYIYSYGWLFANARKGKTNNVGLPNSRDWAPEKPTVLVVGDSFIESLMNDYEDTLQGQLDKKLGDNQVLAMANSGANAADYLQMLGYARTQLPLNAIVITIANNDFLDALPNSGNSAPGHSRFDNADGSIRISSSPYYPSALKEWARKFAIARYLQRNLKFNPFQGIKNELSKSGKNTAEGSNKITNTNTFSEFQPYINFFLKELPVRSGVPLSDTVFVIDCNRKAIYQKWLLSSGLKEQQDYVIEVFVKSAKEQGAVVIDMCPVMEKYVQTTRQYLDFTPFDEHWNPVGHSLVANTVEPALSRILQQ